jgi:hypothetical protein
VKCIIDGAVCGLGSQSDPRRVRPGVAERPAPCAAWGRRATRAVCGLGSQSDLAGAAALAPLIALSIGAPVAAVTAA